MEPPKISVVIPSYNKFKFISETLDSIISQNYPNLEVIIRDGGSTDGTLQIIKEYADKYPAIFKYETGKDKGQLDAINNGFKSTTGEIFSFINADDIYIAGALERVAKAFLQNPTTLWFAGQGKVIDADSHEIAKPVTLYKNFLLTQDSRFWLLVTNYLMQPSVFFTRNAWKQFGPFSGTSDFVTEYDFWLRLSRKEMPSVINEPVSMFRIEPGTITKKKTAKLLREDEEIVGKYTKNWFILGLHKIHTIARRLIGSVI